MKQCSSCWGHAQKKFAGGGARLEVKKLSEVVLNGAALPDGIDVDEAAAYFGITESSASLHTLLEMDSESALLLFLELTSDLHLAKGDFDFNTASERMNCEGGEIYFLVVGHLGMLELVDPLRFWLGMETSNGEAGGPDPGLDDTSRQSIETIADPMSILQLFSIAHLEGGDEVVKKYFSALKGMLASPSSSVESLKMISSSLSAVLHSYQENGAIAGIPSLSDASLPIVAPSTPLRTLTPVEPVVKIPVSQPSVSVKKKEQSVPLPGSVVEKPQPILTPTPPPLVAIEDIVPLPTLGTKTEPVIDKKTGGVESDACAGAFGLAEPEAPRVVKEIQTVEQPVEQNADVQPSMENMLSGITTSGKGDTSPTEPPPIVEEVQPPEEIEAAPPIEIEENVEQASEQQPASHTEKALPKPVMAAPVRTPVGGGMPRSSGPTLGQQQIAAQQAALQQQQIAAQQAALQQQQIAAQQAALQQQQIAAQQASILQQQKAAQQAQQGQTELPSPTIRSGVHCQGCGIGLDPNWNNCPVCGLGQY